LARAWRNNFYKVSQVNQFVFKAHFTSFEAMMWVFTKQPWVVNSDTLLLELENRNKKEITEENYRFEYIYVTIRAYGIPKEHRSYKLLKDILNIVGN
jgi:hypothetical protein